ELKNARVLPRPENSNQGIPIWRGVGNSPASAIKAGRLGIPLFQAHLAGAAQTYQNRIHHYKNAGYDAGFADEELPVGTGGLMYLAESTEEAFRTAYPHFNAGFQLTNGQDFPKRGFAQGKSPKSVTLIGSPELVTEKRFINMNYNSSSGLQLKEIFAGLLWKEVKGSLIRF